MSKSRIISSTLALILALGVCAPQATLASRTVYDSAAMAGARPAPVADGNGAPDDAQQPKRKGNGFARALSAPFRALAKLFGGGKKNKPLEAKRRETEAQPAPSADTPNADAGQTAAQGQSSPRVEEKNASTASAREAGAISQGIVSSAPSSESVRIVRPSVVESAQPKPAMWIPVIEGISKDSLTQGRALLEHGYVQESIAELSVAASTVGSNLVEANNLLGLAYDRMGWHIQAAAAYERALSVAPKDPVVLANLGYSLYLAEDYHAAHKLLKQAAKLAPNTPVIYNNLGIVQAWRGHYDDAFKHFTRASNKYDAHLKLASILESAKRDREAIKHYEAALRLQPGTNAVLERLVALYDRTGKTDKADMARRALGQPKNQQKTTTGGGGGD
ncbi:MAG: tetratricopeptide repeat protein [Rubrivivax sp.]|nr:tetratricopeptide repeat protein [Pyrinomonadaceae bacterium]